MFLLPGSDRMYPYEKGRWVGSVVLLDVSCFACGCHVQFFSKVDSVKSGYYCEDNPEEEDAFVSDAAEGYVLYRLLSGLEKKHSGSLWNGDFSDIEAVKEAYDNGVIDDVDVDCINPDAIDYEDY